MRVNKKAILAAGLIAGAAAMTGCAADMRPAATPTPQMTQQATAAPATAQPAASSEAPEAGAEETAGPLPLLAEGKEIAAGAAKEEDKLLLPLIETAEALGYAADSGETEADGQTKRVITLEKGESRITVSYTVSDNTAKNITWQKDGLLIPVDTMITTIGDSIYVPSAFFEEAADVTVGYGDGGVVVSAAKAKETPAAQPAETGENG